MLYSILLAAILPACMAVLVISIIPAKILGKIGRALSLIATGLLLTLSLTHLIPEAMSEGSDPHIMGMTLCVTIFALIFLEMYFNSKLQKHDGSTCSCPCHILQQPIANRNLMNPNFADPHLAENNFPEPNLSFTSEGCVAHSTQEPPHSADSLSQKTFTIKSLRPQGSPVPESVHLANHCHHGLLQHFGHDHDFNLHGADIKQAQDLAKTKAQQGIEAVKQAFAQGAAPILTGAALHAICDGVVIASSFMIDFKVGAAMTAAVICHEVPQQLSNYVLMLTFGMNKIQGFIVNAAAACGSLLGGLLFYFILDQVHNLLPFALAISGASFVYVALSDILPRLNKTQHQQKTIIRCAYLFLGAMLAFLISHH